jgi:hypothetical protein
VLLLLLALPVCSVDYFFVCGWRLQRQRCAGALDVQCELLEQSMEMFRAG